MARSPTDVPSLKLHKASGQGYVRIGGRRRYLGRFDLPTTRERYNRLIAEWLSAGRRLPADDHDIRIVEMTASFLSYLKDYYRPPSRELSQFKEPLRHLVELYGDTRGLDFGPAQLRAVRQRLIDDGLCRTFINKQVIRLRRLFRWAASESLLPVTVYQTLATLDPLKRGRSNAPEAAGVVPVPKAHIDAVVAHAPPQIAALIQLQVLTAARPSEWLIARPINIDVTGAIWIYKPSQYKSLHLGHIRTLYCGSRSQAILNSFLSGCPTESYLFSPRHAETWRHAQCPVHRRPNQRPNEKKTERTVRDHYDRDSYRQAIRAICERLAIPVWTPGQLRHTAATELRKRYGLEGSQVYLGHSACDVTQIYAMADSERALQIAREVG